MNTNVSLQFGEEREYFPPEIIFDPNDADNCTPVVYFPYLMMTNKQDIPKILEQAAWQISKFKEEANSLKTREEEIDGNRKVIYY